MPKPKKPRLPKYTTRPCATLGTLFLDVYRDGKLFASEVPSDIALWCVLQPHIFLGNVGADVTKLRTWVLEQEYQRLSGRPLP